MLLLDCGNSQLKAQFYADGGLSRTLASSYRGDWIGRLQRWLDSISAPGCYLTSVLDGGRQQLLDQCLAGRFADDVIRFVAKAQTLDVRSAYAQPEKLGDDRWLALIGAREICCGDCIVIDAGSAITLDLLDADGQHLGGAILPGFNTPLETFRRIFDYIDFDDPAVGHNDAPGCSTAAAIQIDYDLGSEQRLPELVERWTQACLDQPAILLAGGDAPRVQALLQLDSRIVPDLVFRGMRRLVGQ